VGIRDEHDGRVAFLPRPPDQLIEEINICAPSQVHQGHCEEVQDGGLQGHDAKLILSMVHYGLGGNIRVSSRF
jgi:hypothetical protein